MVFRRFERLLEVFEVFRAVLAHVSQQAVLVCPAQSLSKIVRTLQERSFEEVSKHKFGCRLMERLIEHVEPNELASIAAEIIPKADLLRRWALKRSVEDVWA